MKKILIKNVKDYEVRVNFENPYRTLLCIGEESLMDANDGSHSFEELYDHRITLYIALCKMISEKNGDGISPIHEIWRSKLHSDGSSYEGWFILGIDKDPGMQITYHLPMDRWGDTNFAETLDNAPEWDKHTHVDVLERIKKLI